MNPNRLSNPFHLPALSEGNDLLLSERRILPHLTTERIGRSLIVLEETDSTNSHLSRGIREGVSDFPEGAVVAAEFQSAGRGRHGRKWVSPPGRNLMFSILFRSFPLPPTMATLIGALSVIGEAADLGACVGLKWPNDIVANSESAQTVAEPLIERKVGGVLCETKASAENNGALILGIGVNVNLYHSELPEELGNNATSLAILAGGQIDRNRLLAGILNRVESNCSVASVEGPAPIIDMARRCCTTLKRRVRIQCGCDQFEGESVDLDPQGRLILRDSTGVLRSIESGEVIQTRRIT